MKYAFAVNIKNVLQTKNARNAALRNNIALSAVLKVIGLLTSLAIVPVTLHYLENETYGIWLTITSILYWFSFFDIGLGNGMRNYLTASVSKGDYATGRAYLSTTLLMLGIIAMGLLLFFVPLLYLLDIRELFNTSAISSDELRNAMLIAIAFTLVLFVVKNIGYVFVALQHYALNDALVVSGSLLSLIVIYILSLTTEGSLTRVVLAFTVIPVLVYGLAAIPIFCKYPPLRPSLKAVDWHLGRRIVTKGLGFFFIQITSCLVIFGSSNLFIINLCGPASVTTYNIAYKFFFLLAIGYTIVIAPMWNAYTDAYVKGEMAWIRLSFRRTLGIWALTLVAGLVMLCLSGVFYKLWVGDAVSVPLTTSVWVLVYICAYNLNNCATYLLNGLNMIRVQIYTSVSFTLLYLLMVYFAGRYQGCNGIIASMAISYIFMSIIHLCQCRLLIQGRATGIWNK